MQLVDGKKIAHELKGELKERVAQSHHGLSLGIIVAHETLAVRKFVSLKQAFGAEIGVRVDVLHVSSLEQTTEKLLTTILHATKEHTGLVLQLPLPPRMELESVLRLFPFSHDVDVLGYTAFEQYREHALPFLPPVVGAMDEVLNTHGIRVPGKRVVVVGEGRLVGEPAAIHLRYLGANVTTVNAATEDLGAVTREADVVVLGAGVPGLLTPDMVKEGVVIVDAGTSESEGVLKGDADPACAEKALLFTPTPGGIGPITVAKVFENLIVLGGLRG